MTDLRIGILGCAGFMGRNLILAVSETDNSKIVGGTEPAASPAVGKDLGTLAGREPLGISVTDDAEALIAESDVVIEFTVPGPTVAHAKLTAAARTPHVIGTTGLDEAQEAALREAARSTPIVYAPNMSPAVNLLFALTEQVARALDADYDIEIVEMHHRRKIDAPSGTALGLGQAAAAGRAVTLEQAAERGRDGETGARGRGNIGFASLRGGDVVGDHTVIFAADGERLELTHKAATRMIFARGAVRAARWVAGREPGLYGMRDVLGL